MNHFTIIQSFTLIYFTKIIKSLPINSTTEQSNRLLFSLKTPIWLAEGTRKDDSYRFLRVHSRVSIILSL